MNEHQLRAQYYQLLANLLIAPADKTLLTTLAQLQSEQKTTALEIAWNTLTRLAAQSNSKDVEREFNMLFIGLSRGELLPYSSYYLTGFLMEKPLALLRQDLIKLGIQRQNHNSHPEDHISAICEVMALLIIEQNPDQADFYQAHINPWFIRFFTDLKQSENANFYQAVAIFGYAFIELENQLFGIN